MTDVGYLYDYRPSLIEIHSFYLNQSYLNQLNIFEPVLFEPVVYISISPITRLLEPKLYLNKLKSLLFPPYDSKWFKIESLLSFYKFSK